MISWRRQCREWYRERGCISRNGIFIFTYFFLVHVFSVYIHMCTRLNYSLHLFFILNSIFFSVTFLAKFDQFHPCHQGHPHVVLRRPPRPLRPMGPGTSAAGAGNAAHNFAGAAAAGLHRFGGRRHLATGALAEMEMGMICWHNNVINPINMVI